MASHDLYRYQRKVMNDAERLGYSIKRHRERAGLTQVDLAQTIDCRPNTLSEIESGKKSPSFDMLTKIARALGKDTPGDLWDDPTTPDPEPPEDVRTAGEHRGAFIRSLPVETFLHADGLVDGSLAIDVITRPSGKSGELLKKRHAQRSDRRAKTDHLSIEGVPLGCELVRAEAAVVIRDQDPEQVIPKGFLLIVDRKRTPEPGQLVVAVKNVNQRETEELPGVRLLRYHQAGRGWSLAEVDGSDKTYGSGDGWEVVAAVLWWRSPP
jgi:putative transcriptional regulator